MCRARTPGHPPKRCPNQRDPAKMSKRNALRRQKYATAKLIRPLAEVRESLNIEDIQQDFHSKWTAEEQKQIRAYTSKDFREIRQHFNDYINYDTGEKVGWVSPLTVSHNEKVVKVMDSALAKAVPAEAPRTLYRGFKVPRYIQDPAKWVDENYQPGSLVEDLSYVSTTIDPGQAMTEFGPNGVGNRHVIFEFITKEGVFISDKSRWASEREVLIPRNTKFKVHAVHKKSDYLVETQNHGLLTSRNTTVVQLVDVDA